jgi:6-phosphogluconolactonase (cycloisomerase 2 family)
VLHTFGPDHLRLMSVDGEGKLTPRPEKYSANTKDWNDRVPTTAVLSPDGKFLVVGTTFDELPTRKNPDGSLILWVPDKHGALHLIASNAPDPDGIVVFPVGEDGALREPSFYDARGASPFYIAFLHNRPDTFVVGYAVSDAVSVGKINADGKIGIGPLVKINTSSGVPSELCWLAVSPDDRFVFATEFGYSYMSSFRIDGNGLSIAKDPASPKVPGDGTFRAINGSVSSGPSDSWISPDGSYLYEIYGNASKLVGYTTKPDGSLEEVTTVAIPYNSPGGLAGF